MSTELATANTADTAVSDSAAPSDELDNSSNIDFWEPEEEQAKPEPNADGTDSNSETDEAAGQETEEPDAQQEQTEEADTAKASPAEPEDSIIVSMPGGDKLELKELKSGYMRDRDYRHKTTEVANKRRDLETMSTRVGNVASAISEILMARVPPAPDQSLSLTDPLRYIQEKAAHEGAMENINAIVQQASSVKEVQGGLTQQATAEQIQSEMSKLTEAVPQLKTSEGQAKFREAVITAGRESGFSDAELGSVVDHRMFKVLHYAHLGMMAEKAKAKAATKIVNVPPVANTRRPAGQNAAKARQNQDAMKRLAQSGSIEDAMSVDFD